MTSHYCRWCRIFHTSHIFFHLLWEFKVNRSMWASHGGSGVQPGHHPESCCYYSADFIPCVLECSGSGWITNPSQWLCCLWVREREEERKRRRIMFVLHISEHPEFNLNWSVQHHELFCEDGGRGLVCTMCFSSLCGPTLSHYMSRLFWPLKLH